jgi:HlyD family secretion protein
MKRSDISDPPGFRDRIRLLTALAPLFLAPLATGCGGHDAKSKAKASQEKAGPSVVEVVHPQRKDLTRRIDQPGQFLSYEHTPIFTKIAGFAEEPLVDINDTVKKGQLLVKLYVPEIEEELKVKQARVKKDIADLKQAKATVKASKAAVDAAKSNVNEAEASIARVAAEVKRWEAEDERAQKMLKQMIYDNQTRDEVHKQLLASQANFKETNAKYISAVATLRQREAEYDKAEADVEVAQAGVELAQFEYSQWKAWLSYAEVRAPFDGVITLRNVHTGHFLQPSNSGTTSKTSEPIFTMMRTDIMRLTVEVPEIDAVHVKVGDKAIAYPQALPGREIEGKVTRYSWSLDDRARTLRVEIHLANTNGIFRPGMYADVSIYAKQPGALTLPSEAVLNDIMANNNREYCMVVENNKCRRVFVQVGLRGEEGVQVLAKQSPGGKWEDFTGSEAIVATNAESLVENQPVQVKESLQSQVAVAGVVEPTTMKKIKLEAQEKTSVH